MSAVTAARASSSSSPSSFATLLRRSKFASYDPQIGQVYTSHGGHAHRGDFGLKRALNIRRKRDAMVTVQSIDTRHQQTGWRSAYLDSTFLKKQKETGSAITLHDSSHWRDRVGSAGDTGPWHVYSEFAVSRGTQGGTQHEGAEESTNDDERLLKAGMRSLDVIPNVSAMSEAQFSKYLRRVRRLRPAFQRFMEEKELGSEGSGYLDNRRSTQSNEDDSNFKRRTQAINSISNHTTFLTSLSRRLEERPSSQTIRPLPHANAGLDYTHAPSMQQFFTTQPLPGRRLQVSVIEKKNVSEQLVAVGGWVGKDYSNKKDGKRFSTDFGTREGDPRINREMGKGLFRVVNENLAHAPEVVGTAPQGVESAELRRRLITHEEWEENRDRLNPHQPGSKEYVGHVEQRNLPQSWNGPFMTKPQRTSPFKEKKDKEATMRFLNSLRSAISAPNTGNSDL